MIGEKESAWRQSPADQVVLSRAERFVEKARECRRASRLARGDIEVLLVSERFWVGGGNSKDEFYPIAVRGAPLPPRFWSRVGPSRYSSAGLSEDDCSSLRSVIA